MGLLSSIGTAIGTYFGGPIGGAAGNAIGGAVEGGEKTNAPVTTTSKSGELPWGTIGDIAGSVISGGLGYFGTQQTNAANAQQAQLNRDFQAGQTGTAYQRAVADMKAAGLSPMLAYSQGGAASGSGSQAVMQDKLSALSSGAKQGLMLKQQLDAQRLDNANRLATIDKTAQDTKTAAANERASDELARKYKSDIQLNSAIEANYRNDGVLKDIIARHAKSSPGQSAVYATNYLLGGAASSAADIAGALNPYKLGKQGPRVVQHEHRRVDDK